MHEKISQLNMLYVLSIHNGTTKNNTFQCILATDNVTSYAIFQYADGLIQWTTGDSAGGIQGLDGTQAQIGVNTGDNSSSVNVPGSRTPAIINITRTSNVQVPGQWIFQLNGTTPLRKYHETSNVIIEYVYHMY